jgi:DNA-binding response OmpR family regulator
LLKVRPDVAIVGPSTTNEWDELSVVRRVRRLYKALPVILITKRSSESQAISAIKLQINDYFKVPPLAVQELSERVWATYFVPIPIMFLSTYARQRRQ